MLKIENGNLEQFSLFFDYLRLSTVPDRILPGVAKPGFIHLKI